jgi:hypothetical protein
MNNPIRWCLAILLFGGICFLLPSPNEAIGQDKKGPKWSHAYDLKARKSDEKDFTKDTKAFGVEIFRDENNGILMYITDTGSIAVAPGKSVGDTSKGPKWSHAQELKVRKTGEKDFTKQTQKFGVEVFKDEAVAGLMYICESGSFGVDLTKNAATADSSKGPKWTHGHELKVRKAGEKEFKKDTQTISLEVFRDDNNGGYIFITEKAMIGVVGGISATVPEKAKGPKWSHAMELRVRKSGENDFTPMTKRYGVEVFRDENINCLIYISETGSLAIIPATGETPKPTKEPKWLHGHELRVRRAGEKDFTAQTQTYSVEVFRDENNGNLIYICQNGSIAVTPEK